MRKEARLLLSIRCMQTRHSGTAPKYDTVKYCNELEFEVARFHIRRHNAAEAVNGLIKFFVYAAGGPPHRSAEQQNTPLFRI